jgi:hypothetical protein
MKNFAVIANRAIRSFNTTILNYTDIAARYYQ